MSLYLGIDTSNYTTSLAIYDSRKNVVYSQRRLLPVKQGTKGLRQSDAVFLHNKALPELFSNLINENDIDTSKIKAIATSISPTREDGSYMPCFTVGHHYAMVISTLMNIPLYEFTHQEGHISSAIYSVKDSSIYKDNEFIAFHISGGTTDILLVKKENGRYSINHIGGSNDLKFGQAVDRIGVKMGLSFPCGKEMEKIASKSQRTFVPKVSIKDLKCNISGLENMAYNMIELGYEHCDVCKFTFDFIIKTVEKLISNLDKKYKDHPYILAGGVMSNKYIQNEILEKFKDKIINFASPDLSCDNAVGIATMCSEN